MERDKKGKFIKGHKHLNKEVLNNWRKKGGMPWNKGKELSIKHKKNLSLSHKGQIPHNYKGGISKTQEYHNFYNRIRENRKKNIMGFHTFSEWEILKAQYNWTCPCCHKSEPEIKLSQDHIIPVSKGGSDNIENIQPLCKSCNCRKHAKIINYENLCR